MSIKVSKKIVGFQVVKPEDANAAVAAAPAPAAVLPDVAHMGEHIGRPEILLGSTYKIKPPDVGSAMYITINDVVLNEGTDDEQRRPFEIFINSKNMDQFQWVVALTRILSAVFRKGGDVTFLVEEMKAVFDPKGGYWKPGGVYMNSLIAEIGTVLEVHLKKLGMIEAPELSEGQRQLMAEKRAAFEQSSAPSPAAPAESEGNFPPGATLCPKCSVKSLVLLDGCQTCLNCGHSKCG
jgi:hypothetical protein